MLLPRDAGELQRPKYTRDSESVFTSELSIADARMGDASVDSACECWTGPTLQTHHTLTLEGWQMIFAPVLAEGCGCCEQNAAGISSIWLKYQELIDRTSLK